jgi:hypothetical protein
LSFRTANAVVPPEPHRPNDVEGFARSVLPDVVAAELAARFAVPAAQVRADLAAILAEWRAHKLLAGGPAPDTIVPAEDAPRGARRPEPKVSRQAGLPARRRADRDGSVCRGPYPGHLLNGDEIAAGAQPEPVG